MRNLVKVKGYAVYFTKVDDDKFGKPRVSAGVQIRIKTELTEAENRNPQSSGVSYDYDAVVLQRLEVGSLVWIGKLADLPNPVTNLLEVVWYDEVSTLDESKVSRTAGLKRYSNAAPTIV